MMVKRYELSDQQWKRIEPLLLGKPGDPSQTGRNNRLFVDGVLWVLRSGARWQDLPERHGKWKSVHKRFTRWAKAGVWERVFKALTKDRDNAYLMLDSTIVRAHQQAVICMPCSSKRNCSNCSCRSRGDWAEAEQTVRERLGGMRRCRCEVAHRKWSDV